MPSALLCCACVLFCCWASQLGQGRPRASVRTGEWVVGGGKAKRSGVRWGEPSGAKGSNVVPSDLLPTRTLAFGLSVLCVRLPVGASWQLFLAGRLLSRECVPSAAKQCGRPTQFSRAQPNQRHECNFPHATSCCRGSCSSCCTAATSCLSLTLCRVRSCSLLSKRRFEIPQGGNLASWRSSHIFKYLLR